MSSLDGETRPQTLVHSHQCDSVPVRGIGEPVRKADTLRKPGLSSPAADLVQSASEGREQRSTGTRAVRSVRSGLRGREDEPTHTHPSSEEACLRRRCSWLPAKPGAFWGSIKGMTRCEISRKDKNASWGCRRHPSETWAVRVRMGHGAGWGRGCTCRCSAALGQQEPRTLDKYDSCGQKQCGCG
ncbi:hypothetical protein VULLAG_LOCUS21818 [Vulpes lagopus]